MSLSDIEIAQKASKKPIEDVASKIGIAKDNLMNYGKYKAKIEQDLLTSLNSSNTKEQGKLILVTAITPTPAGEGKTTTTVGLTDGLNAIGKKAISCLREPSLGPCFGMKGGAAGGGYAQIVPMEDINLHFTGDFHAIGAAHNLLSALLDNHLYWGNSLEINPRTIEWKRVVDMNDRSLRSIVTSLGKGNGDPRESGFDITVASEVMAIFCLAKDYEDLRRRLGNITIGIDKNKKRIYARDINADGAMAVLLKDAFLPNLVQSLENNPSIVHGGPFANIAHGCNSLIATRTGLKLADYVVTEAGFGADLGAEKFMDIKCVKGDIKPEVVVVVATIRALKMHGGVAKDKLNSENVEAVKNGFSNLERHIENIQKFKVPLVVAINHFSNDTDAEVEIVRSECSKRGVEAVLCRHWADGSKGTTELAEKVVDIVEQGKSEFTPIYNDSQSLKEKIETIGKEIYRADEVIINSKIQNKLEKYQSDFGHYQICMAKTQYSFSTDPKKVGAPTGHKMEISDLILNTGAEFLVVLAGDIMRMPGLPRVPAANSIEIDKSGNTQGLF